MYRSYYCKNCREYVLVKKSRINSLKIFLKPTKGKIILLSFLVFSIITNMREVVIQSPEGETIFIIAPFLTPLIIPFFKLGNFFRYFSPDTIMRLLLKQSYPSYYIWCSMITVFYWYLIFCLIVWIYGRVKKHPKR